MIGGMAAFGLWVYKDGPRYWQQFPPQGGVRKSTVGGPSWYKPWSLVPEELGEDHHGEARTTKIILEDAETCLQHFGACCILVLFPGTQIFQKQIVSGTFGLRNPQISPFAISNNQFLVAELPNPFAWFVGPMFLAFPALWLPKPQTLRLMSGSPRSYCWRRRVLPHLEVGTSLAGLKTNTRTVMEQGFLGMEYSTPIKLVSL